MSLSYFDSNVCIGKRGTKHAREIWKTEDILSVMDRTGINCALAYSGCAKDYSPEYGNALLYDEIAKNERFYGCYTIMPGYTGCFLLPQNAIDDLRAKKMVAAIMFPQTHAYSPDETVMGEYYSALESAGVLLIVNSAEISWQALAELLKSHPKLNVLLLGAAWSDEHNIFAYLNRFPNLHIDLSCMQANFAVERIVKTFGADRIVFGSGLPKMSPGAARAFIDYADITPDDKQKIAGGNLARLCGIPLPAAKEVEHDFIAKEASNGVPLSVYTFDSHAHFLQDNGNCGAGFSMCDGDMAHMLSLGEKMGVNDHSVAPWLGIWTDSETGNQLALDMAKRDARIYPYLLIDPNYIENIEETAFKYHIVHRFPGMKMLYSRIKRRHTDPVFDPWWKIANENKLYALLDSCDYAGFLDDVAELAERFPDVSLFLDHAGGSFARAEACVPLAKKYDNVFLQLTYTTVPEGMLEYLCSEGLASKALYGTDAPMRDPRPQLGWVAHADISIEDKKKILGENMRMIASRCFK